MRGEPVVRRGVDGESVLFCDWSRSVGMGQYPILSAVVLLPSRVEIGHNGGHRGNVLSTFVKLGRQSRLTLCIVG